MVRSEALTDGLCPHGAIVGQQVDRERCHQCTGKECLNVNRNQAIRFSAQVCEVDALIDEAKRSLPGVSLR